MSGIILMQCRACDSEVSFNPAEAGSLACPRCKKPIPLRVDKSIYENHTVHTCVACGHDNLYIQKDFNRTIGIAIVVVGCLTSVFFLSRTQPLYAMVSLGVTAAIDYILYRMVGD